MNEQTTQWTIEKQQSAQQRFPLLVKFGGVTFERGQYLNRKERRKVMAALIPRTAKAMANQLSAKEREETAQLLIEMSIIAGVSLGLTNTNDIFHPPTQRA